MRRKTGNTRRVRKISNPSALKQFVLKEARKLQKENLGQSDPMEPLDVSADEYEAGEEADQLEKDIDHLKVLKIEEGRLLKKLKRLREVRRVVKSRIVKKI